ncbi:heavy metal-associated isoprenylated plant protein 36 [Juglans microcarpa x Juglans regia]|uniref:heavy metal-associated isoprenylated plant protein 36 n=1 Tax=Juglans microcarpa x Juglans regia TaxID=2249226 RepID=UPI001B7D9BBA|nr:heavy metal-associated isoprenylated plant protein 36 [Juglans microcarpa x Juglans regia]
MADMQIVPASKNVEAQYVEMMVPLYSYGCEKKIKKTLSHVKGIYSVNVDYNQQKVTVWGICNKYNVLATIRSKRKEARFWNPEDNNITLLEDDEEESSSRPSPNSHEYSRPRDHFRLSLPFTMVRSLSWKLAWKKVFTRSNSF